MKNRKLGSLSSRDVLKRIGVHEDHAPALLLDDDDLLDSPLDGLATALKQRFDSLNTRHSFKPGDLVRWKTGMQNRVCPSPNKPAIVLEVLPAPILDTEKDSGNVYFGEPLDIVLGFFWESEPHRGDFIYAHVDSRRFEPWTEGDQQ